MQELDHLLSLSPRGLTVHEDGDALNNRVLEWLENPQSTIPDRPHWGSNLLSFQFEPESDNLAVLIEMAIVEKLPGDVEGLDIESISVSFPETDYALISIKHSLGFIDKQLALRG